MFVEESAIAYEVSLDTSTSVVLPIEQLASASAAATAFVEAGLPLTDETTTAFTQLLSATIALLSVDTEASPAMKRQVEEVAASVAVSLAEAAGSTGSEDTGDGDGNLDLQYNNVPVPPPPPPRPRDEFGRIIWGNRTEEAQRFFQQGAHNLGTALNLDEGEIRRIEMKKAGYYFGLAFETYFGPEIVDPTPGPWII